MPSTKQVSRYTEAVGRRKRAIARVRLTPSSKAQFTINNRELAEYLPTPFLQNMAREALETGAESQAYQVSVKVLGGGIASQADAVRLGIARALVAIDPEQRKKLKRAGFLKRDPRAKERRKFGLKKARKSAQWSKR